MASCKYVQVKEEKREEMRGEYKVMSKRLDMQYLQTGASPNADIGMERQTVTVT